MLVKDVPDFAHCFLLEVPDFAQISRKSPTLHMSRTLHIAFFWKSRTLHRPSGSPQLCTSPTLHGPSNTVHFNLKPTNILLDEKYNPKISDFGLSRLLTTQDGNTMNNNRFQNALGYVAPELECQNLRVNEKCDVYGFGVLILELVTGRRPVEYGEDSFVILSEHVRVLLEQGNVLECIDPAMEEEYSEDEVLPVLKVALVCTSQIPSNRPTMAEIVQILQVINSHVPHRVLDSF